MKHNKLIRSLFSVTGVILVSKLLGFVKQMVTASAFGASIETDIIHLAEGFVNDVQYLLVQVLLTSFTAVYIHVREKDPEEAGSFAAATMQAFCLIAAAVTAAILLFAPLVARVIAPTYAPEDSAQLVRYLRLFIPALLCFVCIAVFHSLLNANQRFIPGELVGANQSVILMILVLLLSQTFGVRVLAIAFWCYTLYNTVFLGILSRSYICAAHGNPFASPAVRQLLKMALPLLLGYSMVYVNQQVDKILSSGLTAGTVTAMGYAAVLSNLVGTFIGSFASILFTYVTTAIARGDDPGAAELSVRAALILVLVFAPISILTIICAQDIAAIVFGHGAFSAENVRITGYALQGYALMFVPLIFRDLFSRYQYGYHESRRPMINSTVGIVVNIVLSILLCPHFGVFGITVSTSISVMICGILNVTPLWQHGQGRCFQAFLQSSPWLLLGCILCVVVALQCRHLLVAQSALLRFLLITLCAGGTYALAVLPIWGPMVRKWLCRP